MGYWWQFDNDRTDDERGDEIEALEKAAIDAIKAIVALADAQPDRTLIIGAALRKISTVAQSNAQTIRLRSMTVRPGARLPKL